MELLVPKLNFKSAVSDGILPMSIYTEKKSMFDKSPSRLKVISATHCVDQYFDHILSESYHLCSPKIKILLFEVWISFEVFLLWS